MGSIFDQKLTIWTITSPLETGTKLEVPMFLLGLPIIRFYRALEGKMVSYIECKNCANDWNGGE